MAISIKQELDAIEKSVANGFGAQKDLAIEEQNLTTERLKALLPKESKVQVTQATVDMINHVIEQSGVHKGLMEERLLSYTHLLGPGVGIKQLLKAIQFCILSTTPTLTQTKAYLITFPEKAEELISQGRDASSFASMYAKTKLVQDIMQASQIGMHIVYAPLQHQLVEKLLNLSNGVAANGEKASATVQLNATLGLLEKIALPAEQTINLKTGMDAESKAATQNLAEQIEAMARIQLERLQRGESINAVQQVGIIIDAEVEDNA